MKSPKNVIGTMRITNMCSFGNAILDGIREWNRSIFLPHRMYDRSSQFKVDSMALNVSSRASISEAITSDVTPCYICDSIYLSTAFSIPQHVGRQQRCSDAGKTLLSPFPVPHHHPKNHRITKPEEENQNDAPTKKGYHQKQTSLNTIQLR